MITLTFQVENQQEGTALLTFYDTLKDGRQKSSFYLANLGTDFEQKMRAIKLKDLAVTYGLDTRSINCLKVENLNDAYSIGSLYLKDEGKTLLTIPNLGKRSLKAIVDCLDKCGFFG